MTNALTTIAQSMQGDLRYMDTISQNMVNIATPGYRRSIPLSRPFEAALQAAGQANPDPALKHAAPALTSVLDLSTGSLKQTGKAWDVAINGEGYFEIATAQGPAYTRAGDFRLDASGRLVTQGGLPVQGMNGDIILNGANAAIDHAGNIVQEGDKIGQIKIVRFTDARALVKSATGLLQAAVPENGAIDAKPELQVGYLENSNVTPMREMVLMMETTRHFEAAQKLFQGYDEMLGTAIQKLGEF